MNNSYEFSHVLDDLCFIPGKILRKRTFNSCMNFLAIYYFLQSISWILQFESKYSRTVWKWQNFPLPIFWQKFCEGNFFNRNSPYKLISRKIFQMRVNLRIFHTVSQSLIFTSIIPSGGASQKNNFA